MQKWFVLAVLALLGLAVLAACGDAPPTETPIAPTATPIPTDTPVPTPTTIPPLTFACGKVQVTATLEDTTSGSEGGHRVDLVRRAVDPRFSPPLGPWHAVHLTASSVEWASVYLLTPGNHQVWLVRDAQVTAVTDEARGLSASEIIKSFPACAPPLDAIADYMFNAVPLP